MKNPNFFIDLTQRPPRSFRVRLGNYVILARMLDKGRATLAGKNGEYVFNSPTDQHLVKLLGFDPDALLKELAKGNVPCVDVFRMERGKVTSFNCYNLPSVMQQQLGLVSN